MPKQRRSTEGRSVPQNGTDFAMEVARDMVVLPKDERGKAIRMLTALNETINRETEALTAKA